MLIFKTKNDLNQYLLNRRRLGEKIGFVPTMGALHEGHLSLINLSKKDHETTVCSIFINPTQFTNTQDFEKYPITIERDIQLLRASGCQVLFLPEVSEMYPEGVQLKEKYELGAIEHRWEGEFRPGHFQGVCQIVEKLLLLVEPDTLFLGQKDFQQVAILKQMLQVKKDLQWIQIIAGPTLRETDGLAMSSRNLRLSPEERLQATSIYKGFQQVKLELSKGEKSLDNLCQNMEKLLLANGFSKVEYIAFVEPEQMVKIDKIQDKMVLIVAAHLGEVRLIDNYLFRS
ncbi:pantoate--beta-alanine ligase [Sandaracinomonas limnophila]|uniref:Pantothenate synthetase n=1 Tax=Sandaracinomonas limnophila TaxID=1862386 RepID=A0A437PMP0_9BACT|nr:pantoate--beta-alanine ligase [Sandaracinomonas limnophila]RVU23566.1 pantoate--beta-alanine ligase [Sandaracinomonas limnophila]